MKVESSPDMIAGALREAGRVERAVIETGRRSPAICHGLRALGIPVVCIDARQAHQSLKALKANKTDPHDAAGLAQLARTGFYKRCTSNLPQRTACEASLRRATTWSKPECGSTT